MDIKLLQKDIATVNKAVNSVKAKLRRAITKELSNLDLSEVEDTDEDEKGLDFRIVRGDDLSFSPDNANDEDEYIVAITVGERKGAEPSLWSYDEDSGECDPIALSDDRLTMDDLLEVLKIVSKA